MRLQFVRIGQNLNWPRGRLSLARKKNIEGNIYDSRFSSSNKCIFFIVFNGLFNKGNRKHFPRVYRVYRNTRGNLGETQISTRVSIIP